MGRPAYVPPPVAEADLPPPAALFAHPAAPPAPIIAMGLPFPNRLGLAAGFDRSGALLPALAAMGFGHVEVGTVSAQAVGPVDLAPFPSGTRIGVNIGSARRGIDAEVIADYAGLFHRVAASADYVVANLSSPLAARDGDSEGVDLLICRVGEARDALAVRTGRRVPLLIKLAGGAAGSSLPAAIPAARRHGFDGVILVSACVRRIAEVCDSLGRATLISVGGVATAEDVAARIAAGAALVQVYTAFAREGAASLRRLLPACG